MSDNIKPNHYITGREPRDLPVGFRFRPTEREMSKYFLKCKVFGQPMRARTIPQEFPLLFSTLPRYFPGYPKEKHWYYYCKKHDDQVTTLWTQVGEDTNVFDPDHNGELVGIRRQFTLTEQAKDEETTNICFSDDEESPKYNWFLDEISLPVTVAVSDWVMCHVFRKKNKPQTPHYLSEPEPEPEPEE